MLREIAASPLRATEIKKSFQRSLSDRPPQKFSPEKALSLIVSAQLTTFQYSLIRKSAVNTDPLITGFRHLPPLIHKNKLDRAVKALLQCDLQEIHSCDESGSDDDLGVSELEI